MGWETDPNTGKRVWVPDEPDDGAPRTQVRDLPDGRTVLIDLNTGEIIKDYGRAAPAAASARPVGTIEYNGRGEAFEWSGSAWLRKSFLDDPSRAADYVAPRQGADPQSLAIQRAQLDEQIRGNQAQEARDNELLLLNRDKFRVETESGKKAAALATQQLLETIQTRMDANARSRDEMMAARSNLEFQIAASQQEAARGRAFEGGLAQQESEQRAREGIANRNLTREGLARQDAQERARLGLERDRAIAEFAAEPGDVGRVSALLNRGGLSNISTALGQGETAITDQSLAPLASLLAPGPAPYEPQFETYTPPDRSFLNALMASVTPAAGAAPVASTAPTVTPQADTSGPLNSALSLLSREQLQQGAGNLAISGPQADAKAKADALALALRRSGYDTGVPKAEDGAAVVEPGTLHALMTIAMALGMEPKAIAGERGEADGETVMSNGDVVILPDKGKAASGKQKMQAGGTSLNELMALARAFMANTGQTTLQRSGFAAPPTPISLADPGTSRFRRTLGAATTATTRGIPQDVFAEELNRLIPMALQQGYRGRTR